MSFKIKACLALIIILAFILRFYQISVNPPGLNGDEAAIGYNAYSIFKTGKDEYGQTFPLTFRSFDDYKPPLYIYLTVPSVAVFGLNEFSIRFPSAFLGVLAVALTFFLTRKIFRNDKTSLLAAFLLAVSPWHIQFTRTAYETGSQAFFTALGLLLLTESHKKFPYAVLSGLVFGLELFLYQAARVFIPLFVLCALVLRFWGEIRSHWQNLAGFCLVFGVFFLITADILLQPSARLRLTGTSIFQDTSIHDLETNFRISDWQKNDNKSVILFHNPAFDYSSKIIANYLSHFSPEFLVSNTANPIDFFVPNLSTPKIAYVPTVGLLHLWELPFLIAGLYYLAQGRKKIFLLFASWLLLVPLPAALTLGVPSSVRTAAFLPAIQIITSYGVIVILTKIKWLKFPLFIIVLYQLAYFFHMLFVHSPEIYSSIRYPVYKQMVLKTAQMANDYNTVIVSTRLDVPYIFFLTYLKYDPARYRAIDGGTVSGGFAEDRNHFSKYFFKHIDWVAMHKQVKTLFVGTKADFPSEAHVIGSMVNNGDDTGIYFARSDNQ